jgi:hypothetical protein
VGSVLQCSTHQITDHLELQWGLYSFMVRDFSFTKIWGCIAWISLVCFFLFGSLGVCMFTESMKLHGSATAKDSN